MKRYLAAAALAATLAQPASAITFPSLTTIYVGAGVFDNGTGADTGQATSIHCSNVSGGSVQVRVLVLSSTGDVEGSMTVTVAHGQTTTISTHQTFLFSDNTLSTGLVSQGVVNIEATNSGVFCTAVVLDAANAPPIFMSPLNLVRVNAHPGTVE